MQNILNQLENTENVEERRDLFRQLDRLMYENDHTNDDYLRIYNNYVKETDKEYNDLAYQSGMSRKDLDNEGYDLNEYAQFVDSFYRVYLINREELMKQVNDKQNYYLRCHVLRDDFGDAFLGLNDESGTNIVGLESHERRFEFINKTKNKKILGIQREYKNLLLHKLSYLFGEMGYYIEMNKMIMNENLLDNVFLLKKTNRLFDRQYAMYNIKTLYTGDVVSGHHCNVMLSEINIKDLIVVNSNILRIEINNVMFYIVNDTVYFENKMVRGEIVDNMRNGIYRGNGEMYQDNELIYRGDIVEGKREGKGEYFGINGVIEYKGDFVNDMYHGEGIYYFENGVKMYEGSYENHMSHGQGILYNRQGQKIYEGEFKNDNRDGQGILYDNNRNKEYEGGWLNDEYHGIGVYYHNNGNIMYEGEFFDGLLQGNGIMYNENRNKKYKGQFENNQYHGQGILYYENGKKQYKGEFFAGEFHGQGIKYYKNERIWYDGGFRNNKYHGMGTEYNVDGSIKQQGRFNQGIIQRIERDIPIHGQYNDEDIMRFLLEGGKKSKKQRKSKKVSRKSKKQRKSKKVSKKSKKQRKSKKVSKKQRKLRKQRK